MVGSIQGPAVLTPHVGEMARLIGSNSEDVTPESARSHAAALRSANGFEMQFCSKDHSLASQDGQRIDISTFGGPVLSRGGSGDILTSLSEVYWLKDITHSKQRSWQPYGMDRPLITLLETVDILPSQPHNCSTTYTNRYAPKHHSN